MLQQPVPTVADWMTPAKVTLSPDDDILHAVDQLVDHGVTAGLVVDADGHLVGVLGVTNCLRVLAAAAYEDDIQSEHVRDAMTPVELTIDPDIDLFQAVEQFLRCHVQTLPVVRGGNLLGRINRHDLLRGIRDFAARELELRSRHHAESAAAGNRPRSIEAMQKTVASRGRLNLAQLFSRIR